VTGLAWREFCSGRHYGVTPLGRGNATYEFGGSSPKPKRVASISQATEVSDTWEIV